jgi:hypothetical protein
MQEVEECCYGKCMLEWVKLKNTGHAFQLASEHLNSKFYHSEVMRVYGVEGLCRGQLNEG